MNTFQVYRSYEIRRDNQAWWDAKKTNAGWNVRFHADYVPSTDWTCAEHELFAKIEIELNAWKLTVEAYWAKK